MTPLSIAFSSPTWPAGSSANGVLTYVSTVTPCLRAMGHEVSILAAASAEHPEPGMYDARDLPRGLARRAAEGLWYRLHPRSAIRHLARRAIVGTARRMAAERRLDVFEMEEAFGWAASLKKATGAAVVVRLHGPWFLTGTSDAGVDEEEFRWRVAEEGRAIAAADLVTAPAQDVLRRVREHYGIPLANAEVIPNPIPPIAEKDRWRLEECDPRHILFVGRFERLKGGDLVVDAFARVLAAVPDARLSFVGPDLGVTMADGRTRNLAEYVRERVPGALEAGRIALLGRQPFSALAPLRRQALVSVVCSRYENFPYTAIEAMALGCPVVAARVGGIPEIVQDGVNGLLHRADDAGDLADAIVRLLRAPGRAADLGRRAAADCERLAPEAITLRLDETYRRLAGRRPR